MEVKYRQTQVERHRNFEHEDADRKVQDGMEEVRIDPKVDTLREVHCVHDRVRIHVDGRLGGTRVAKHCIKIISNKVVPVHIALKPGAGDVCEFERMEIDKLLKC